MTAPDAMIDSRACALVVVVEDSPPGQPLKVMLTGNGSVCQHGVVDLLQQLLSIARKQAITSSCCSPE